MQLPQTAGVLVPLGVGAVVVIIALVVLIVRARRKRRRSSADVADVVSPPEPTESDWTGEAIYATAPVRSSGAHPVTVAEAMAGWRTDKSTGEKPPPEGSPLEGPPLEGPPLEGPPLERPLPAALDAMLTSPGPDAVVPVQREPSAMGLAEAAALPLFAGPAGQSAKPVMSGTEPPPATSDPADRAPQEAGTAQQDGAAQQDGVAATAGPTPADAPAGPAEPVAAEIPDEEPSHPGSIPAGPWARSPAPLHDFGAPEPPADLPQATPAQRPADPRPAAATSGSSRTVAAAVAQALAVRAAAGRPQGPEAAAPPPPVALRGDARDRLLAVLLDDPVRAVGAAVELESCREQLDRLTHAVSFERGRLGEVLGKLVGAGLRPDQLARLAGMPLDEVRELLPEPAPDRVPQRGA